MNNSDGEHVLLLSQALIAGLDDCACPQSIPPHPAYQGLYEFAQSNPTIWHHTTFACGTLLMPRLECVYLVGKEAFSDLPTPGTGVISHLLYEAVLDLYWISWITQICVLCSHSVPTLGP